MPTTHQCQMTKNILTALDAFYENSRVEQPREDFAEWFERWRSDFDYKYRGRLQTWNQFLESEFRGLYGQMQDLLKEWDEFVAEWGMDEDWSDILILMDTFFENRLRKELNHYVYDC